jgi:hypothetical protein
MKRAGRLAAALIAAGIFATGAAAGVAFDRLVLSEACEPRHRRPRAPGELLERYRKQLDLDGEQARAVGEILERRFREADAIMSRVDPDMEAIRQHSNDEIRAVLRPEQHARFAEIVRKQEERRAQMRKRVQPQPAPGR